MTDLKYIQTIWNKSSLSAKHALIELTNTELGGFLEHNFNHINSASVWSDLTRKEQRALERVVMKITKGEEWRPRKLSCYLELKSHTEDRDHHIDQVKICERAIKRLTKELEATEK